SRDRWWVTSSRTTMSNRQGCAAAAMVAAASALRTSTSSATTMRVRARPLVTPPAVRRSAESALTTALPVVSQSPIMKPTAPSRPPPGPSGTREHLIRGPRPPLAGPVRLRLLPCPRLLQRVHHVPARLHLGGVREQRLVAEEDVEDEPLVRLGAGVGERLAVLEVHRDVADLHRRAGHL